MKDFEKIMNDLRNKVFQHVYFLMGEEPYFIDKISDYIEQNALDEAQKSFNQIVIYGLDTDMDNIINTARRFPMMSEYQVVIIKEAQHINNIDNLVYYVEAPLKSTILVIDYKYKKLDKRKKLYAAIAKNAIVFESDKLYDSQIPEWITGYLKQSGMGIQPEAAVLLSEYLGNDLGKIVNELEKLKITIPANEKVINTLHIEKNIGISKDYNNFELQNALISKDVLKANRIINYFGKNPKNNPMVLTLASLYYFFSRVLIYHKLADKSRRSAAAALKISPYFVQDYQRAAEKYSFIKIKQIISLLREYDLKSKGIGNVSNPDGELLKELVYKILHS
ncbi:MAG TPA: DNA polymerase III subunit delta [Bacteroidales bacterium]|nr:DNA polymerase III subunit delta [Bacteroidales bacterium]